MWGSALYGQDVVCVLITGLEGRGRRGCGDGFRLCRATCGDRSRVAYCSVEAIFSGRRVIIYLKNCREETAVDTSIFRSNNT